MMLNVLGVSQDWGHVVIRLGVRTIVIMVKMLVYSVYKEVGVLDRFHGGVVVQMLETWTLCNTYNMSKG